ncbi:hypothetical protein TBC1_11266 [Lentimicrobium saccharophilum]|uniref:Peptidase family M3 n=1 Tax=Lentimicrobium saccharophilum TaxID=1678841 RepID=A0A0S7BZH5_9BACT|nr:hypothetical protein [Lentimicrobium saccharophilum]GAP42137.1 hypothetical protein TBC1_11266 [Lentimicrobium saccharophilum]
MRNIIIIMAMATLIAVSGCNENQEAVTGGPVKAFIEQTAVEKVIQTLNDSLGEAPKFRIERGVQQVANLWRESDGTVEDFEDFCLGNFVAEEPALENLYRKLERNFEIFNGYFHKMDVLLKEPIQLEGPEIEPVDMMFGSYNAAAHLTDDFFNNKIAFLTALNFPFYSLKEKTEKGATWSRLEWAYARMGDRFTSRIPAEIIQQASKTLTEADAYISDYNIYMGRLVNDKGENLFPDGMKLITHWGLRDELKSNYAGANGLEKQRMIYDVMKRIIDQSIPQQVINKDEYTWNPADNKLFKDGAEVQGNPEPDKRYEVLLGNFHAMKAIDAYNPNFPTYISRAFEEYMEIPQEDVERLFTEFVSSPQVKEVAAFISQRLGRPLEPFDIWYNGFKSRGGLPEEQLTAITSKKYPDPKALQADLPNILVKLGWPQEKARQITSLISVDPSRGAGHAWGAEMRNDIARLRTRIGAGGMDYKGYNIAVHEFGHNVEQTVTMNDVDYYMLQGVPNTAFTEAVAFLFQKRDLELLGMPNADPNKDHMMALDNFWASYEIMGVSLVDMKVWKWMYDNPAASPAELKEAVISAAKEVWNNYYAGILGGKDEPILAIYSHMIDNPLYLSNYPMGHLIDFQIEQQVKGKNLADEFNRMYTQGRLVPQVWMKGAVGQEISIKPTMNAATEALKALQ